MHGCQSPRRGHHQRRRQRSHSSHHHATHAKTHSKRHFYCQSTVQLRSLKAAALPDCFPKAPAKSQHTGRTPARSRPRITKENNHPAPARANQRMQPIFDAQSALSRRHCVSTLSEHPTMLVCTPGSTPHPKVVSNGAHPFIVWLLSFISRNPESRISLISFQLGQNRTALHSLQLY